MSVPTMTHDDVHPFVLAAVGWAHKRYPGCMIVRDATIARDARYTAPEMLRSWRSVFAGCALAAKEPEIKRFYMFLRAVVKWHLTGGAR